MDELLDGADATALAGAIRRREVSAGEVLEASIARIEARDPALHAVVARRFDEARAEVERGLPEGPLTGVPFLVKDLKMDVAGLPTTNGSRLLEGRVAAEDSELVARFRRAGLVVLGKTNTPEWGLSPSTEPALFGPTRNPHRPSHSPGGSSGGTAAAIASGMVPVGHGNDGGGSLRIPASACGLVGLKPSRGRVPASPRRPAFSYPLGVNGAISRTVRDTALLLDVASGAVPGDVYAAPTPRRPFLDEVGAPVERCRVALATTSPAGAPLHPDGRAAVDATGRLLEQLGHVVEPAMPPHAWDAVVHVMRVCMATPLAAAVDAHLAARGRELADDDVEPFTRVMIELGRATTGTEVVAALEDVERAAHAVGPFFEDYDVWVSPTLGAPTPPLGHLDTSDLEAMYTRASVYSSMTSVSNVTGQPAISLPLATDADGMPLGVQLVAGYGREDLLIRLAAQLEEARPWRTAPVWPPA